MDTTNVSRLVDVIHNSIFNSTLLKLSVIFFIGVIMLFCSRKICDAIDRNTTALEKLAEVIHSEQSK